MLPNRVFHGRSSRDALERTALVVASFLGGCAGQTHGSDDASVAMNEGQSLAPPTRMLSTAPCEPLSPHGLPIQLGNVIAAGKDAHGTLYVADQTRSDRPQRVFVSSGDSLYRKHVSGSGQMGMSDFTWSFDDDGADERLVVHKQGDQVTGIALSPAGERTFFAQLDGSATRLTPVDPGALAAFDVRDLPGEDELDFAGDAANGSRIVIIRPTDDSVDDDDRVFYGTNGRLLERVSSQVGPMSYQRFDFIVDGATWHMVIGSSFFAPGVQTEIEIGATSIPLTPVAPSLLSNNTFECFVR